MKKLEFPGIAGLLAVVLVALGVNGCAHVRPQAFTFVQMCDPQIGFDNYEADLARFEAAVRHVNELKPDFVVICGDLVNTPNPKSFRDFNAAKAKLDVPAYCAPGNHDLGNKPTSESLKRYRKSIGKDYFQFNHRGVRFLILNTQLMKTNVVGETEKQDAWLSRILEPGADQGGPVLVVQHYPPFVKTPDEPEAYFNLPPERRRKYLAAVQDAGAVAILAGHTHTTSTNQFGRIQVVTGETTSKAFDKRPYGFRLWHVNPDGSCWHEFVPLRQPLSAKP